MRVPEYSGEFVAPMGMRIGFVIVALMSALSLSAADSRFSSGPLRVSLLELFTSEGCSSCPPAEQWLADRRGDPGLWKQYVPISFHITYWDHLGWRDLLAQPAFTARQRAYATQWANGSVYTPCFVRDGQEWRPEAPDKVAPAHAGELTINALPSGEWEMKFLPPHGARGKFDGYLALLGRGMVSRVRAGENRGKTLTHEFVALSLTKISLQSNEQTEGNFQVAHLKPESVTPEARAVAAWVTTRGEISPLQATGGELQ
jgi:hypothetical protein